MNFINFRTPSTPGLYGVLLNAHNRNDYDCFTFAYWNGIGWKLPSECDLEIAPYRTVTYWCKLEIGTDWNGYD